MTAREIREGDGQARPGTTSRRGFLGSVSAAAVATGVHCDSARGDQSKSASETVRIGLVGAGGRGSGAVVDSLSINQNVQLAALADFDIGKAGRFRDAIARRFPEAVAVPDQSVHGGLDAYRRLLDDPSIDLVLFATPPGFRPGHLIEAVDAGKHVFAEKPTCVDPAGYRRCLAADQAARARRTSIVTGTQYRRQENYVEAIDRIHQGQIGDVRAITTRYCATGIWYKPRRAGISDTRYQIENWMHFIWLSGDQIVEQAIHNLDVVHWIMAGPPVSAYGSGGRFTRPEDSEMWDNMAVDFDYPDSRSVSFMCRQIPGTESENGTIVYGSEGTAEILAGDSGASIRSRDGESIWSMPGNISAAYRREHRDLVDAIRDDRPIVELRQTAESSMLAVLGRMAAYTGRRVSWDFASEDSQLDLVPDPIDLESARASGHAVPGREKLI